MLYSIESDALITDIPYRNKFDVYRGRLTDSQYAAICDELNRRIDEGGGEVATAGWLPGADWSGTVFDPIYEVACRHDFEESGKFFGLIVWDVMMRREEDWASGKFEKDGVPIQSRTYFRINR